MAEVGWAQFLSPAGRLLEKPVSQVRQERLEERAEVWRPTRYRGRRAIATWWRPAGQARHAGCATLGALEAALSLEFDPQVVSFTGWPLRLGWADSGQGYVPDFFARLADGRAAAGVPDIGAGRGLLGGDLGAPEGGRRAGRLGCAGASGRG